MLRAHEVRALAEAGWEVGAHTITHPDLSALDYTACRREIDQSRIELEHIAGVAVETFAYPSGSYGPAAVAAVRDSGLVAAVSTGRGGADRYTLPRAMIGGADPMPLVLLKLADRYEPLLQSAPMRMARHTSKRMRGWAQQRQQQRAHQLPG